MLFANVTYANTIITAPIDSRPVSTDYLSELAKINSDTLIYSDKNTLDFFSAIEENNYTGNSKKVRNDIYNTVSENNTSDTIVIINTSSYFTNGLVGSRCGVNYSDYIKAINDLKKLTSDNKEPYYYINLCMPRTLPETRFNQIWPYEEKLKGLGYYYIKNNPNSPLKNEIKSKYSDVLPVQFLLEYGYVEAKSSELGIDNLSDFEKEFLVNINKRCAKSFPFREFLASYRKPFEAVSDIFDKLANMKKKNMIDEIIISNDDFQLPDFVNYMYSSSNDIDWIKTENNSPVKYSFARKYMTSNINSIQNQVAKKFGKSESALALSGKSDFVNFIFGTDEVPQLIYARSISKKSSLSGNIIPMIMGNNSEVAKFDVLGVDELLTNDLNFVTHSKDKTKEKMYLFLYNYNNHSEFLLNETISQMQNKLKDGAKIGLIEIYSTPLLNTGDNILFKTLVEGNKGVKVSDLSTYSAWNTNANAIGLGVAHSQVYMISNEQSIDSNVFLSANTNMLIEHLLEDGIYTINTKRTLSNERYIPTQEDLVQSKKLLSALQPEKVLKAFKGINLNHNENSFTISDCILENYSFPWGRTFECYLKINTKLSTEVSQ